MPNPLGIIATLLLFLTAGVIFGLLALVRALNMLVALHNTIYTTWAHKPTTDLEDTAKERRDERQMGIFEDPTARYGRTGFTQEAPVLQAQRTEAGTPQEGTGTGPTTYPGIDR